MRERISRRRRRTALLLAASVLSESWMFESGDDMRSSVSDPRPLQTIAARQFLFFLIRGRGRLVHTALSLFPLTQALANVGLIAAVGRLVINSIDSEVVLICNRSGEIMRILVALSMSQ